MLKAGPSSRRKREDSDYMMSIAERQARGRGSSISLKLGRLNFTEFFLNNIGMRPRQLLNTWKQFWQKFPGRMRQMHIDALLVPAYRHEWGKYQKWDSRSDLKKKLSPEEHQASVDLKRMRRSIAEEEDAMKMFEHCSGCRILTFNISGIIFQTQQRTVNWLPYSLLGNKEKRSRFYNPEKKQYFFERHPGSFKAILHFYQTKGTMLNRPYNISFNIFEEEVKFFQLGHDVLDRLRTEEGFYKVKPKSSPPSLLARKIWLLFENPNSSQQARLVAMISIFIVVVSIVTLCMETLPLFKKPEVGHAVSGDTFFLTEAVAVFWFCFELIVRFLACHKKTRFMKDYMNIIDLVAIVPFFLELGTEALAYGEHASGNRPRAILSVLRIVRLVRILRIFKLSRHSKDLKVLGLTLKASLRELGLLLFFLIMGVVLFSAAVYYTESGDQESTFTSIPAGFHWAVGTMTTLGAGDMVPVTTFGKIVGGICAVAGVLTLALPVPVIVSNFNYFRHREINQQELENRPKRKRAGICPFQPECEEKRKTESANIVTDHDAMMLLTNNAATHTSSRTSTSTEQPLSQEDKFNAIF